MIQLRNIVRSTFLWGWDHSRAFAVVLVLVVIGYGIQRADRDIRAELRLAVLDASAEIGHLFRAYEATDYFTARRILELCTTEMNTAVGRTPRSLRLSLQGLAVRDDLLYDSQEKTIRQYDMAAAVAGALPMSDRIPTLFGDEPFYVEEQQVADEWKLRTVITGKNYLHAQGRHFALTSLPLSLAIFALFVFPRYYQTVLTLRHFERVIEKLLNVSLEGKTEQDVLALLPQLVRAALDVDACTVYVLHGEELELHASDPPPSTDPRQVRRHISLDGDSAEAVVARRNRLGVVNHSKGMRRTEALNARPVNDPGSDPYIIVPIIDPQKKTVAGVLTARKGYGVEESTPVELATLVRLVMLLFNNARAAHRLKETFNRTIRQTRQVALGTVVPVVAHNLGKPIGMVAMGLRDLAEKWRTLDPAVIDETLTQYEAKMMDCYALLQRLVRYRKIGVRSATTERGATADLQDVLTRTCAFFEAYFQIQQIRLVTQFEPDLRPRVALDELDVVQVVSNLFINSYEAFRDAKLQGPRCEVMISVGPSPRPDGIVIRIADNGPGIPPEYRDRIFDDDFTSKPDGTGAGLPYCRDVVRQAGGELELDTTVHAGAAFNIYLPTK